MKMLLFNPMSRTGQCQIRISLLAYLPVIPDADSRGSALWESEYWLMWSWQRARAHCCSVHSCGSEAALPSAKGHLRSRAVLYCVTVLPGVLFALVCLVAEPFPTHLNEFLSILFSVCAPKVTTIQWAFKFKQCKCRLALLANGFLKHKQSPLEQGPANRRAASYVCKYIKLLQDESARLEFTFRTRTSGVQRHSSCMLSQRLSWRCAVWYCGVFGLVRGCVKPKEQAARER